MQRSLPIPSASRASPRNRRHYPPQLGSTHRKRSQHRPQSNRSLANLMTPGVSKSLTRSAETAIVEELSVTLGNIHDGRAGHSALPDNPGDVYADSAYRGQVFASAVL